MFVSDTRLIPDAPPLPDAQPAKHSRYLSLSNNGGKTGLVLPAADTKRWSSRRKAAVIVATRTGILTRHEACERYLLSDEELAGWESAFDKRGIQGLRIASGSSYRSKAASPSFRS